MKLKKVIQVLIFCLVIPNMIFSQYQKVNSNGLDIYYRIFGKGEPILIIGGGPGDVSDRYLSLCELLSQKYQCVLVEQRGTGKSSPEISDSTTISISLTLSDFEEIRKKIAFDKWTILGFSYGGYLSSLYAHFYPGSISSLVLLNSMGLGTDAFEYFSDNIDSKLQESDRIVIEYWSDSARYSQNPHHAITEMIRAKMPGYFYDRKKSLIVSQTMKDSDFNFEVGQWIWKDIYERKLDLSGFNSDFSKPVLIIHGRQDPLGESVPQSLHNYYKQSKLRIIEKCGHYSWIEQPENVLNAIADFLSEH